MITKLQVKYIQSLDQKKFRDREGVFVAEGSKMAGDVLVHPEVQPVHIYVTAAGAERNKELLKNFDALVSVISVHDMQKISFLKTAADILVLLKKPIDHPPVLASGMLLLLDGIQDPGNLGTIIRLADWFGISHLVCSETTADAFAPKVVQATMGSILRINIHYTELAAFMANSPATVFYAATLDGENVYRVPPLQEGALVIGSEAKGISEAVLQLCRHRLTIPRIGQAESLNAAVATGILLSRLVTFSG